MRLLRSSELEERGEMERALFRIMRSMVCGLPEPMGVANSLPSEEGNPELGMSWEREVGVPVWLGKSGEMRLRRMASELLCLPTAAAEEEEEVFPAPPAPPACKCCFAEKECLPAVAEGPRIPPPPPPRENGPPVACLLFSARLSVAVAAAFAAEVAGSPIKLLLLLVSMASGEVILDLRSPHSATVCISTTEAIDPPLGSSLASMLRCFS